VANPQAENGHVDIANEIIEALCRTRIPGEAMQVLLFILRKTYGWHKKEDAICLSQFVNGTGLNKPRICEALKRLRKMNFITEKRNDSLRKSVMGAVTYGFQKDYEKWEPLRKTVTLRKNPKGFTENRKQQKKIDPRQKKINTRSIVHVDFLTSLKRNPAYQHIDIDNELAKMDAWLLLPRNQWRKKTPRFILNWLNRIEKPLTLQKPEADEFRFVYMDGRTLAESRHARDHDGVSWRKEKNEWVRE